MSKKKSRSVEDIRADLAANRQKLTESLGQVVDDMQPKNIAKRGLDQARDFAVTEANLIKNWFVGPDGLRMDRVAMVGGAVAGVLVFATTMNSISKRRKALALRNEIRAALTVGDS